MVNAQEWLETNRERLLQVLKGEWGEELDLPDKNLEGELSLDSAFKNIVSLEIEDNKITDLNLKFCWRLTKIDCYCNLLTNINFLLELPHPEKLQVLILSNNNIQPTNLDFLSRFTNLKKVRLGSDEYHEEQIQASIFNRFCGSLEPLKHLKKLIFVDINNTDIDSGLEHLEKAIGEGIKLSACCRERPDARVGSIWKELEPASYREFKAKEEEKKLEESKKSLLISKGIQEIRVKLSVADINPEQETEILGNTWETDYRMGGVINSVEWIEGFKRERLNAIDEYIAKNSTDDNSRDSEGEGEKGKGKLGENWLIFLLLLMVVISSAVLYYFFCPNREKQKKNQN